MTIPAALIMYNSIKIVNKKLSTPVSLICPLQIFVQEEESLGVSEYPSLSGEIISPFFSTDPPYQNFVYTAMANMPRITIYTQSPLHHSDHPTSRNLFIVFYRFNYWSRIRSHSGPLQWDIHLYFKLIPFL